MGALELDRLGGPTTCSACQPAGTRQDQPPTGLLPGLLLGLLPGLPLGLPFPAISSPCPTHPPRPPCRTCLYEPPWAPRSQAVTTLPAIPARMLQLLVRPCSVPASWVATSCRGRGRGRGNGRSRRTVGGGAGAGEGGWLDMVGGRWVGIVYVCDWVCHCACKL